MTIKQSKRFSSVKLASIWKEWQEDKYGKFISNIRTYGSISVQCEILKDGYMIMYEKDDADDWQSSGTYNKVNDLLARIEWLKQFNKRYQSELAIVKRIKAKYGY